MWKTANNDHWALGFFMFYIWLVSNGRLLLLPASVSHGTVGSYHKVECLIAVTYQNVGNFQVRNCRKVWGFVAIFAKFSAKFRSVVSFGVPQANYPWKFSLWKLYFVPVCKSFLLKSFPQCGSNSAAQFKAYSCIACSQVSSSLSLVPADMPKEYRHYPQIGIILK